MSLGLQILSPQGRVTYDTSMVTWNQLATATVAAGEYKQVTIPEAVGRETLTLIFMVDAPPLDRAAIAARASFSGSTWSIGGGNVTALAFALGR